MGTVMEAVHRILGHRRNHEWVYYTSRGHTEVRIDTFSYLHRTTGRREWGYEVYSDQGELLGSVGGFASRADAIHAAKSSVSFFKGRL